MPFPPAAAPTRANGSRHRDSHQASRCAPHGPRDTKAAGTRERRGRGTAPSSAHARPRGQGAPLTSAGPCAQRPRGGGREARGSRRGGRAGRGAAGGGAAEEAARRRPPGPIPGCTAAPSAARSDWTSSCHPRWGCSASGSQSTPSDGPSWREGRAPVSGAWGGAGMGGGGRARGSWGRGPAGPGPHTRTHTPVLLQFVVDFSGSDPETQTDRRLREEDSMRRPS